MEDAEAAALAVLSKRWEHNSGNPAHTCTSHFVSAHSCRSFDRTPEEVQQLAAWLVATCQPFFSSMRPDVVQHLCAHVGELCCLGACTCTAPSLRPLTCSACGPAVNPSRCCRTCMGG